jgi:UDP-N-acetylmuramoyl-tripeptide--D-alanyl-D-alanine ligase
MEIIFLVSNIVAFAFLMIYHMHMYQLNSYNIIEEKHWLQDNKYPNFGRVFGLFISIIFLVIFSFKFYIVGMILAILLNVATSLGNKEKESKISLKYTPRVKRMLLTSSIIYALYIIVIFVFIKNIKVNNVLIQILPMFCPYIIMMSNVINRPVEKHINDGFVNEAKQKINSMQNLTVIGITGSYGKTTVKQILGKLLSKDFNVLITPYNYNTTLGVTITIREYLSPIHDIFVCEMGAKGVGEIKEICDIVNPRYGIITSIGEQHLETFLSVDNIIKTKFELADSIKDFGTVFLNYDNEYIKNKKIDKNVISYAIENKDADYVPYDIKVNENGSSFMLKIEDEDVRFETKIIGLHNVLNIAGCIAVAHKMGVSSATLVQRVKQLEQVEHRQQIIKKDFGVIIDDAYNSNPAGAKSALDTLSMFDMTKIVITPGMVELGEKQYELNKEFGKQITEVADYIVLVGKNQSIPIQDGIKEKNYDEKRLYVVDDIKEALNIAYSLKSDKPKAILLENDLPDNY